MIEYVASSGYGSVFAAPAATRPGDLLILNALWSGAWSRDQPVRTLSSYMPVGWNLAGIGGDEARGVLADRGRHRNTRLYAVPRRGGVHQRVP